MHLHPSKLSALAVVLALVSLQCTTPEKAPAPEASSTQPPPLALRAALELRPLGNDSPFALALAEGPLPTGVEVRFGRLETEVGREAVFTAKDLSTLQAWSRTLKPPGMRVAFEETTPPQLHFILTDDGFVVQDATAKVISRRYTGESDVQVDLTPQDRERFADLSGRLVDRKLAIVLEDRVLSAPTVRQRIDGGSLVISLANDHRGPDGARALVSALTGVAPGDVPLPAD